MSWHQQVFALLMGGLIFLIIVELVRRRKLKEEYTWLWLVTGVIIFLLVIWYDFLGVVTKLIGAKIETSALFIFGLLFLILINIWFSVKMSAVVDQVKNLIQEMAILKEEIEKKSYILEERERKCRIKKRSADSVDNELKKYKEER